MKQPNQKLKKYITIMVTATKVKAIHIPYHTLLLPLLIHKQGRVHLPSILPGRCGYMRWSLWA